MMMEVEDKMYQVAYVAKKQDGSRAVDPDKREITGWASKPVIDRDRELIEWDAWDLTNFKKNPVLMTGHDYQKNPIGRVIWVKATEEGLMFKAKFPTEGKSATADEIFNLYEEEIMNAFSVGFKPVKWEDGDKANEPLRRYTKAELYEISSVGLPSCTEALIAAYRAGNLKTKGLQDAVQSVLDDSLEFVEDTSIDLEDEDEPFDPQKPYPNEHACRLNDPGKYDRLRRRNGDREHDGKKIDVIYGIKDGKSEVQALRYPKEEWTAAAAKAHCKDQDGSFEAAKILAEITSGEVSGAWEEEEYTERDPLEAMRQEGIEKAEDGFVSISVEMWNALCNSLQNALEDKADQLEDAIDPDEDQSEMIEMSDDEFDALVEEKLNEKREQRQREKVQNLSDNLVELKTEIAKATVQQGGIA
jgi:HK97 family phage prohead protease